MMTMMMVVVWISDADCDGGGDDDADNHDWLALTAETGRNMTCDWFDACCGEDVCDGGNYADAFLLLVSAVTIWTHCCRAGWLRRRWPTLWEAISIMTISDKKAWHGEHDTTVQRHTEPPPDNPEGKI